MHPTFCILLLMTVPARQFTMENLETNDGIIYSSFTDAYVETSMKTLSYKISLNQTKYLKKHENTITNKCANNAKIAKEFNKQLYKKHPIELQKYESRITQRSNEIILSENKNLEAYISKLEVSNNSTENCKILSNIINELKQINVKIDRITSKNNYVILDFISLDTLRIDLKSLFRYLNTENQITAFNINKPFRSTFFDKSDFFYETDEETIYLGFHIPLFTKTHLVRINPRPMILKNTLCIYDKNDFYTTTNVSNLMTFSNKSYSENCNWDKIERKLFCRNPTKTNNCDEKYILHQSAVFDEQCFRYLPKRNIVTRKHYDVYFTLFTPLHISISCDTNTFELQLNKSTKITDLIDCSIKTQFYTYNSSLGTEYEFTISPEDPIRFNSNKQIAITYFLLYFTILMIICLIVNYMYNFHKRKSVYDNYSPNPHIFISESRQLNVALAREAVIIHDTFV